ncbi:hypothetical protein [Pyxidicoccus xibeiensis]|uniref:hypothetical protein n=1 Tax=Pyxidicoccus xibeiensis TaxID=2906759 RepID=UPI0020A7F242|nr:hypothetical protein [Pyxidicoccus xibeiensis]MCP3137341.1 hypothetical protein [Pyxidicoccus xibeiensis]
MKLLVLPPHRDVTLVPDVPEGWHLVDAARDFCLRVSTDASVAEAADARERGPVTAQSMRELLLLRAAQALMQREDATGHTGLRALGAVLTALSGPPSGVRLRLDDIELENGTTERSQDVLRVVSQPAPYSEDLARAAERFASAERVRLWLDRDLQLPAAAWLARACPLEVPLEVAGPFAVAHRKVLARMPMFQRAEFVEASTPLRWRVAPLPGGPDLEPLYWIPEALELTVIPPPTPLAPGELMLDGVDPVDLGAVTTRKVLGSCTAEELRTLTGGAPWGGHVGLESVLHAEVLLESGCRVAVVGFCSISGGTVLEPTSGYRLDTARLLQGARRLRDAGVRLVAEWWVGAPGVDEAELEETLAAPPLFEHVAGVRPFHWGLERPDLDRQFRRSWIQPKSPPADRDLARSRPFDAPNTLSGSRLSEVMESLSQRLLRRAPLNPGRVAAACLRGPSAPLPVSQEAAPQEVPTARGPIRLDADCALVQLPATLDGTPRPAWYAANLRTGAVLAMDARLAPGLSGLTRPALAADVLGAVPEAQREKLVDTLVAKAVLTRVRG